MRDCSDDNSERRSSPLCASATLVQKHEIGRKRERGLDGQRTGQEATALDAAGAGLGSLGLFAFAISSFLKRENVVEAFFIASIAWLTGVDKRMVA